MSVMNLRKELREAEERVRKLHTLLYTTPVISKLKPKPKWKVCTRCNTGVARKNATICMICKRKNRCEFGLCGDGRKCPRCDIRYCSNRRYYTDEYGDRVCDDCERETFMRKRIETKTYYF